MRSPKSPTVEEIEDEREASGHVAYRTWCGHCARARGLRERHAHIPEEEKAQRSFPAIGIDYFWNGESDKEREHELPSLQVKDEHSGMTWACVAEGPDQFAVDFMLGVLDECGYKRSILKSDNEPAIKALKAKVKETSSVEGHPGGREDRRQALDWRCGGVSAREQTSAPRNEERAPGELVD